MTSGVAPAGHGQRDDDRPVTAKPTASDSQRGMTPIQSAMSNHLGLLASGAIASFFLLRLIAISRGNIETAYGVLEYSNPTSAVFAAVFSMVPIFIGGWMAIIPGATLRRGNPRTRVLLGTGLASVTLVVFAPFLIAAIGILVAAMSIALNWTGEPPTAPQRFRIEWVDYFTLVAFMLLSIGGARMWLPTQALTEDGAHTTVYVLTRDEADLIVLEDSTRTIRRVDLEDIESLEFCARSNPPWYFYPLPAATQDQVPVYPPCGADH